MAFKPKSKQIESQIKQIKPKINQIFEKNKRYIESNLDQSGLLIFPLDSRLLETLLLATYFKKYYPDMANKCDSLVIRVYKETLNSRNGVPSGLDDNIQKLLFDLYMGIYKEKIAEWYHLYHGPLQESFKDNDFYNRIRKLVVFDVIALFSCTDSDSQQRLLNLLKITMKLSIPIFAKIVGTKKQKNWNQTYPLLFKLIADFKNNDIKTLQALLQLQAPNGSWFQHHTLTLIALHTLKFNKYDLLFLDYVEEAIYKAEFYLRPYLNDGLSIIHSQVDYNTILYYSLSLYLEYDLDIPESLLRHIIASQNTKTGGWAFLSSSEFSEWDTTSLVMIFLILYWFKTKDNRVLEIYPQSIAFMKSVLRPDGGFVVYQNAFEPLAEVTARGVILAALLPPSFIDESLRIEILQSSIRWLKENQSVSGSYQDLSYSISELYPLSQVALALHAIENSKYLSNDLKNELAQMLTETRSKIISYLQTAQNLNGSYSPTPHSYLLGEQQSTTHAILAWALLKPFSLEITNSLVWMINNVKNPPISYPEGTGPRPLRYNDLSHGTLRIYIASLAYLQNIKT